MSEPFEVTVVRRLTRLERQVANLAVAENGFTMGDVIGTLQMFPELRGFWPLSSVNESGNLLDLSGQGRTLTNGGTTPRALLNNIVPYATLNGASQYFSRADEAGLDITGNLTLGAWFYINTTGTRVLMSKENGAGNRSFQLYTTTTKLNGWVSTDGTATALETTTGDYAAATWQLVAMRFTPSTEIAVFKNLVKETNTVGIPATIFNGNGSFYIGRNSGGSYLPGRVALPFLCAGLVPDSLLARFYEVSRGFFGV